eukprot:3338666-Lingulodinium_polyedra.AAC.1
MGKGPGLLGPSQDCPSLGPSHGGREGRGRAKSANAKGRWHHNTRSPATVDAHKKALRQAGVR